MLTHCKNSGAHQKNFKEDRPISLVAKCRPITFLVRNMKCIMRICAGVPSESGVIDYRILATYTCVQIVLLDRRKQSENEWVTSVCWSATQCCHLNSFCVVFRAQMWVSALYFVSVLFNARCSSSFCKAFHVSFNLLDTWMGVYQWCADLQIPNPRNSASASVGSADGRSRPQTTTTNEHKWLGCSVFTVYLQ